MISGRHGKLLGTFTDVLLLCAQKCLNHVEVILGAEQLRKILGGEVTTCLFALRVSLGFEELLGLVVTTDCWWIELLLASRVFNVLVDHVGVRVFILSFKLYLFVDAGSS